MRQANVRFNYHDYLRLLEDKRYEILDGELHVVPAPSTKPQRVSLNLEVALYHHVNGRDCGNKMFQEFAPEHGGGVLVSRRIHPVVRFKFPWMQNKYGQICR